MLCKRVDDTIDTNSIVTMPEKVRWMDEEMAAVQEGKRVQIPECLSGVASEINTAIRVEMGSIRDDAEHSGLRSRTEREIRHYNWRTLAPCMSGVLLVINGKYPRETKRYMEWIQGAMLLGGLIDLHEDLDAGFQKVPVKGELPEYLSKDDVLKHYDRAQVKRIKRECVEKMVKNVGCFWEMGLPVWQSLVCTIYTFEAAIKRGILMKN